MQVERDAPDQGDAIRLGRVRQSQLLDLGQDEAIDRVLDPTESLTAGGSTRFTG